MGEADGGLRVPLVHRTSFNICLAAGVVLLEEFGTRNGARWGSWIALIYFAAYAAYCIQNWFNCREIHCAVTGPGFLLAAILQGARIAGVIEPGRQQLGIAVLTQPWIIFVAAFLLGKVLEMRYEARYGTIFMRPKA